MHRNTNTAWLHSFIFKSLHVCLWLTLLGSAFQLNAQKRNAKEERLFLIDSTYTDASRRGLNTDSILRYEFYFADPDTAVLRKLATRLAEDTFEIISIEPADKVWKLGVTKHLRLNRDGMENLDSRLRWLRYSFLADDYVGFVIKPRDLDPVSVEESVFHDYISALSDDDLFWVSQRLSKLKNYPRALVALRESVGRNIYPDTIHFLMGHVLIATNEFNDGTDYWEKALRINPDYLEAHMRYAQLLYTNTYFKRALEHYQQADRIKSNDPVILYHIAETLYQLKRYNESLAYANRSYKLDKKHPYTKSLIKLLKEPRVRYLRKQELKALKKK
jgi:tetratricopeptide (TPR) repeat protein